MSKKHRVYLPSLTERTKDGKVQPFPLLAKLEKRNVNLLRHHGYKVEEDVKVLVYRVLPKPFFNSVLLYIYLFLQDLFKGTPFNSERYPYFLMFLVAIYGMVLTEKQDKALNKFLESNGSRDIQLAGHLFKFKKQDDAEPKTESVKPTVEEVIEIKPKKIVLIASDFAGVGKSTFSNTLVESLGEEKALKFAFMDELRSQLSHLFVVSEIDHTAFYPENYNKTKNVLHSYSERFPPFILRELICDYSDLLQTYFGETYWASLAEDFIKDIDSEIFVIDDLRRPIELNHMIKQFGAENVITVYLTKVDAVKPALTGSSLGYEGLLNPADFNIQFEFNSDWSNTPDLIKTITERL